MSSDKVVIETPDVKLGIPKTSKYCPLANAINRQLDQLPEPCPGPIERPKIWRPYVRVYGGDPDPHLGNTRGWIRVYHPSLPGDYMIFELNKEDTAVVREFDSTGKMPIGYQTNVSIKGLVGNMEHEQGVPPEGLPIPEMNKKFGMMLTEEDGETPDWVLPGAEDEHTYPRYYCHCYGCVSYRQMEDMGLESECDLWDEDICEGWDENRA